MKNEVKNYLSEKMDKTLSVLKDELHHIRAGRANPQLLDRITVEYYGADTPLNQLAGISVPEPRMLQIQPYDASVLSEIEKAIHASDLGINPNNDGKVIRLVMPMLTEERRKDLSKVVKKTGEDAKVAIRNERRHANDMLKKAEKNNEITEDDLKSAEKEVQTLVDQAITEIDSLVKAKEAEIMEV